MVAAIPLNKRTNFIEENRSNKQVIIYTTYYKENQKLEAITKQEEIVDVDGSDLYLKQQKIISNSASIAPVSYPPSLISSWET